jgi:hypothetical protein
MAVTRSLIFRATTSIEVSLGGEGELTWHPNEHGRTWEMRAYGVRIEYVWESKVGYWRTMQSTIWGGPVSGPCPDEYTYERQDRNKPLWLAALELRYYPKGLKWNT